MSKLLTKQLLLSNSYWVLNKDMVKLLGLETAFLLSNFAEAEIMMSDEQGWFYQTADTVERMTTLSRHKQDQCIKELEEKGILEKDVRGMPPKRYFKINYVCLTNQFVKFQQINMRKTDKSICKKSTTSKERTYKELNHKELNNIKAPVPIKSKKDITNEIIKEYNLADEVESTFNEYLKMRKEIKAPMSDHAIKLLLTKLTNLSHIPKDQKLMLENAIMGNWKSVFEIKKDNKQIQAKKDFEEREYDYEDLENKLLGWD